MKKTLMNIICCTAIGLSTLLTNCKTENYIDGAVKNKIKNNGAYFLVIESSKRNTENPDNKEPSTLQILEKVVSLYALDKFIKIGDRVIIDDRFCFGNFNCLAEINEDGTGYITSNLIIKPRDFKRK